MLKASDVYLNSGDDPLRAARALAAYIAEHWTPGCALLVGLSGPQGSGKTTLAEQLEALLTDTGLTVARLSIDDIYLTRAERQALAAQVHPLLATRGPPGTHDLELAWRVFADADERREVVLPRFDKAIDDRLPPETWDRVAPPVCVVLFEGWCVGAAPEPADALLEPINALERDDDQDGTWRRYVNQALEAYQPLFGQLDLMVQIVPPGFETVVGWRQEQEAKLRAARPGAPGLMSDAEVERFVAHYERVTRRLIADGPARADAVLRIDAQRAPVSLEFRYKTSG